MESVDSSNAQSDDKSRETFQRKFSMPQINGHTKDFKSFQVKYTDSKQLKRLEIFYYSCWHFVKDKKSHLQLPKIKLPFIPRKQSVKVFLSFFG